MDTNGGLLGVLCMAAVAFSYALGNIYARVVHGVEADRMALGQQTVSATGGLILACPHRRDAGLRPDRGSLAGDAGAGAARDGHSRHDLHDHLLSAGPTRAAMLGYLMPVWATMLAVLFSARRWGCANWRERP